MVSLLFVLIAFEAVGAADAPIAITAIPPPLITHVSGTPPGTQQKTEISTASSSILTTTLHKTEVTGPECQTRTDPHPNVCPPPVQCPPVTCPACQCEPCQVEPLLRGSVSFVCPPVSCPPMSCPPCDCAPCNGPRLCEEEPATEPVVCTQLSCPPYSCPPCVCAVCPEGSQAEVKAIECPTVSCTPIVCPPCQCHECPF
eukprot:Protomagalhaensia_sp_Gyna_25__969@NODE_1469_length_1808_cov_1216_408705_g1189_i0_p1_GENE_NODE_1469_length_1808_cov_1216_408705_g1189_i0NODE_1469_length_1808_cov_1216_408705_g1189_i0_p1_ORF_typecomplete_len200_score5_16_NODE_1469_length_1808_cov_1216_408705_g1189_i010721671